VPVKQLPCPADREKDQHRCEETTEIEMQFAQEAHPSDALTKVGRDMPLKEAVRPDLRNLQSESK
jgi:hypothetical protein